VSDPGWADYVQRFHAERPGITERVLGRCRSDGIDPYQWCAKPIEGHDGLVMDIACGSGPMATHFHGWFGTDCSAAELTTATDRGRGPLVRASATRLPFATNATDALVCSMAMQVIQPVPDAITELARVLRPGGRAVLLLPATGPITWRHAVVYLRLQAALRRRIRYPNDRALGTRRLSATAAGHGLTVTSDERRAFALPIGSGADVDELVRSLYLPSVTSARLRRARRVLSRRVGTELAVPLRRVVLDRSP